MSASAWPTGRRAIAIRARSSGGSSRACSIENLISYIRTLGGPAKGAAPAAKAAPAKK